MKIVREISRNYQSIGGQSPLLDRTTRQSRAIVRLLDDGALKFRVYLGMRHWCPWIEESVGQMIDDGIERAVSLVLTPQYSSFSVEKYQRNIDAGLDMYRGAIEFAHIDSYHDAPGLVDALAGRVREGLSRWHENDRGSVHVVFSAHSLPVSASRAGDPYDSQAKETARLVAAAAGLSDDRWSWSYQSAGRSAEAWLGPSLKDHLSSLSRRGVRDVIIVPAGFVSDHVEILYDIDIDARQFARDLGMRLERPSALNDDPTFMQELADQIRSRAVKAGWT